MPTYIWNISLCSDSIAFATEPVLGSLANLLGNTDRMPAAIPPEIKVNKLN